MSKEKIKYVPKEWQEQVKLRYEELSSKGWDWRSFWNGALEGFYLAYLLGLFSEDKASAMKSLEKENEKLKQDICDLNIALDNQSADNQLLRSSLEECSDYLHDNDHLNSIGSRSRLHREMDQALSKDKEEV